MQLNGTSEQEKYLFNRITNINNKISDEDAYLRWDQEKIIGIVRYEKFMVN